MPVPDYADPTPAYLQIAADLRDHISAGAYDANEGRLPSNKALTEKYGVADGTIRQALEELRSEGIVATRSTRGTFVADKKAAGTPTDRRAVSEQLAALRQETGGLAERARDYEDLRSRVGRIEAILVNLHKRLGFPNPYGGAHDSAEKAPRRRQAAR